MSVRASGDPLIASQGCAERRFLIEGFRSGSGSFATFAAIRRASSWLSSLCGENQLLHTKTPSVPGLQKETNDTGLVATSKRDTHNGA
jgi:hypothetical protein